MPELTESQQLSMNVITLNTAVNDLQTDVRELNKIVITGNGEVGLRETVRNHSAVINEWKTWIKFFIGLMITQAVTVMGAIVVAVIKFLPVLERLANKP